MFCLISVSANSAGDFARVVGEGLRAGIMEPPQLAKCMCTSAGCDVGERERKRENETGDSFGAGWSGRFALCGNVRLPTTSLLAPHRS